MKMEVERGELYWIEFEEEGKSGVYLIVQNDKGNKFSPTTIVVPVVQECTSELNLGDEIPLVSGGVVLYEPRTIAKERIRKRIGKIKEEKMKKIDTYAKIIFDFKEEEEDVYWVTMPGKVGSEQKGKRPCVVLKNQKIVIPLTGSKNMRAKLPTQFEISENDFTNKSEAIHNGMEPLSRAMTEQMQFIWDENLIGDKIATLKRDKSKEMNRSINISLAIE